MFYRNLILLSPFIVATVLAMNPEQQYPFDFFPPIIKFENPLYVDSSATNNDQKNNSETEIWSPEIKQQMDALRQMIRESEEERHIAQNHEAHMQQQIAQLQNEVATYKMLLKEARGLLKHEGLIEESEEDNEESSSLDISTMASNFFNNIFAAKK